MNNFLFSKVSTIKTQDINVLIFKCLKIYLKGCCLAWHAKRPGENPQVSASLYLPVFLNKIRRDNREYVLEDDLFIYSSNSIDKSAKLIYTIQINPLHFKLKCLFAWLFLRLYILNSLY